MNSNVLDIGHLAYTTGRMDDMLHFYCGILGFEDSFPYLMRMATRGFSM